LAVVFCFLTAMNEIMLFFNTSTPSRAAIAGMSYQDLINDPDFTCREVDCSGMHGQCECLQGVLLTLEVRAARTHARPERRRGRSKIARYSKEGLLAARPFHVGDQRSGDCDVISIGTRRMGALALREKARTSTTSGLKNIPKFVFRPEAMHRSSAATECW
jgi:hypothetical protein